MPPYCERHQRFLVRDSSDKWHCPNCRVSDPNYLASLRRKQKRYAAPAEEMRGNRAYDAIACDRMAMEVRKR